MTIKLNEEWKQEDGKYKCPQCSKIYTKGGICSHIFRSHTEKGKYDSFKNLTGDQRGWSKGLTKETDTRIKKIGDALNRGYANGSITPSFKGKHHTEETKVKLSQRQKLAHKEGRAWNIGKSRWNNKQSYPETFFTKVINNEFDDKQFKTEFNVSIYSIDFAWPHKKLAIEIDGDQHQRFQEYIERDIRKDKCLSDNGWRVLRIKWKDMCNNTQYWINEAKEFIGK